MNERADEKGLSNLPGPFQFLAGLVTWMFGAVLAVIGSVLRAFPMTAPIGSPFLKLGSSICYNGGYDMGQGVVRTLHGAGKLTGKGILFIAKKISGNSADKLLPPTR